MILLLATSCTNSQMSSDSDAIDTATSDITSIEDQESEIISQAIVTFNVDIPLEIESRSFIKMAGNFNDWDPLAEAYAMEQLST